jgi:hypothetical protein
MMRSNSEEARYLRSLGLTWEQVGNKMGISKQAAQQAATYVPSDGDGAKRGRKRLADICKKPCSNCKKVFTSTRLVCGRHPNKCPNCSKEDSFIHQIRRRVDKKGAVAELIAIDEAEKVLAMRRQVVLDYIDEQGG